MWQNKLMMMFFLLSLRHPWEIYWSQCLSSTPVPFWASISRGGKSARSPYIDRKVAYFTYNQGTHLEVKKSN